MCVRAIVHLSVWCVVCGSACARVGEFSWALLPVGTGVGAGVGARLGAGVGAGVGAKVGAGVGAKVGAGVGARLGAVVCFLTSSITLCSSCSSLSSIDSL